MVQFVTSKLTLFHFLAEINTSSVMGLMKEVVVDRSIMGEALEENIVVVAACNPCRKVATTAGQYTRVKDLGKEWASGHYQVSELSPSMSRLKWTFGSLNSDQEKEFVYRRLEDLSAERTSQSLRRDMTELITTAHESMREFAYRHIRGGLQRLHGMSASAETLDYDAQQRSCSVVSLRDIQRVFSLRAFFRSEFSQIAQLPSSAGSTEEHVAVLLAVGVVYYLRLDTESRRTFVESLCSTSTGLSQGQRFVTVLSEAINGVTTQTCVPTGIALTRGLKENIFMTFVCSLSQTPLLIVGPPGSSKTLSVNTVAENANGEESLSSFYKRCARLSLFHYQCSRLSTSKEIASIFERATRRQEKVDNEKHRCLVFMDEAGLPEEEKESLKVLHYLLEGHMSAKAKVGFVAISNHVLDAAKSNRCVMLLRQESDPEEMLHMTQGVLFDKTTEYVEFDSVVIEAEKFASSLSRSYSQLTSSRGRFAQLETFFGLRDYIHFLKAVRVNSTTDTLHLKVSFSAIVFSVERNFNGVERDRLIQIALLFLEPLKGGGIGQTRFLLKTLRHPFHVVRESIRGGEPAP